MGRLPGGPMSVGKSETMSVESVKPLSQETGISVATPADFYELMKPRVMQLVIFTALVGMVVAPGSIDLSVALVALLCISIGAGASGALNMWYDSDIDAIMARTIKRPIPQGRVAPGEALAFGVTLSVLSVMILGVVVNWLAAFLLAFTIFFYAVVYTMWLKRSTPQNIVIGGAAGAFPPMIGWAAVTGNVSVESIVLFAIIFLWTPPHFWSLALFRKSDYEDAAVPMMPNVLGDAATRFQTFAYAVLLALCGLLPAVLGFASLYFGILSALLGVWFVYLAWNVWRNESSGPDFANEKRLFGFSIVYLFTLFGALAVDAIVARMFG